MLTRLPPPLRSVPCCFFLFLNTVIGVSETTIVPLTCPQDTQSAQEPGPRGSYWQEPDLAGSKRAAFVHDCPARVSLPQEPGGLVPTTGWVSALPPSVGGGGADAAHLLRKHSVVRHHGHTVHPRASSRPPRRQSIITSTSPSSAASQTHEPLHAPCAVQRPSRTLDSLLQAKHKQQMLLEGVPVWLPVTQTWPNHVCFPGSGSAVRSLGHGPCSC